MIYVCIFIYLHTYTCTHICRYVYIYIHILVHTCVCMYAYTHKHAYAHTRTHTLIRVCAMTQTRKTAIEALENRVMLIFFFCMWDKSDTQGGDKRRIHICDMTHVHVCHDSFMCVPWLIYVRAMTQTRKTAIEALENRVELIFFFWCVWHDLDTQGGDRGAGKHSRAGRSWRCLCLSRTDAR